MPGSPLLPLLDYLKQTLQLGEKPVHTVEGSDGLVEHQASLRGLPGVHLAQAPEEGQPWLVVERLTKTLPPDPPAEVAAWFDISTNPYDRPTLRSTPRAGQLTGHAACDETPPTNLDEALSDYLQGPHATWATAEKQRLRTIKLYRQLFTLAETLAQNPDRELVWGWGIALWKHEAYPSPMRYPLLTQSLDVLIDPRTQQIALVPTDAPVHAELNSFLAAKNPGAVRLKGIWEEDPALAQGLTPWTAEGRDFFQQAVGLLDADGQLLPETALRDDALPAPTRSLQVAERWVIFDRKRSAAALILDLAQLARHADTMAELPSPIQALLTPPDQQALQTVSVQFKGVYDEGATPSPTSTPARELYFPLPSNREQIRVAEQQEAGLSQVVEGPPGTGKSHTIVNLMAHAMASGKSVLVTSKGAPALAVLKDKLPAELRALCVFMLQGEKDGMREFEASIHYLSQQVSRLDAARLQNDIVDLESQLDTLHSQIAAQDQRINAVAESHLTALTVGGQSWHSLDLVEHVRHEQASSHADWLNDALPIETPVPDLPIARIADLRRQLGDQLATMDQAAPTALWPVDEALRLHERLKTLPDLQVQLLQTDLPWSRTPAPLSEQVPLWEHQVETLLNQAPTWLSTFERALPQLSSELQIEHARLAQQILQWGQQQQAFLIRPVDWMDTGASLEALQEALQARLQGQNGLRRWLHEPKSVRQMVASVRVEGDPMQVSELPHALEAVTHQQRGRRLKRKWLALAGHLGLPVNEPTALWLQTVETSFQTAKVLSLAGRHLAQLPLAQPPRPRTLHELHGWLRRLIESDRLRTEIALAIEAQNQWREAEQQAAQAKPGPLIEAWRGLLRQMGTDSFAVEAWQILQDATAQHHHLTPFFEELRRHVQRVAEAGAPQWAQHLLTDPIHGETDLWTPEHWAQTWAAQQRRLAVDTLPNLQTLAQLQAERHALEEQLQATRQRVVVQRTWLRVLERATPAVRVGLEAYLKAVKKIGKGTGKAAGRHRHDARQAMAAIYQAIPCWVMPHDRVVEFLPSRVGDFDLVILDEASQSDLRALPALLRGRQWLVVGDEKQVSPANVGKVDEEEMLRLRRQYLRDAPFAAQLTPDNSIYDLCKVALAGQGTQVVLVEHFRCHPAIIEFSNREYYHQHLKALRIQHMRDKFDPPLVDVHVIGGVRKGKLNLPEAQFIVDEIKGIVADPAHAHRTIGVVSLLGTEQVAKIQDMLLNEIGEEAMARHQIECGDAARFQGKERSIMFLSMVATSDDHHPATRLDDRQRFNVAASRARDRMYLVHSVTLDDLTSFDDQKRKLLAHFQAPFIVTEDERERAERLFESPFEKAVYTRLVQAGYRVRPQVPVGGFRLDLVVEGSHGRKLAVECDGDRFHTLEQWPADMARQRTLERVGWRFWRCFASNWYRDPEGCFQELVATLSDQGVEPGEAGLSRDEQWVEHRQVEPVVNEALLARKSRKRMTDETVDDEAGEEETADENRPEVSAEAPRALQRLQFEDETPAPPKPSATPLPDTHPLHQFCAQRQLAYQVAERRGGTHWVHLDQPDGEEAEFLVGLGFRYKPGKGFWKRGKL